MTQIVNILIDSVVHVATKYITSDHIIDLKDKYTYNNPDYYKKKRLNLWVGNTEQNIRDYDSTGKYIFFGRGCLPDIIQFLDMNGYHYTISDNTFFKPLKEKIVFKGVIRDYQKNAIESFAKYKTGTLRGPPGCGKTVILIATIARIGAKAIVVVHNQMLLDQWCEKIVEFLGFSPNVISGSEMKNNDAPITIAMQQKLRNCIDEHIDDGYSIFVGDEVHRWAANTFRKTAKRFRSRYMLGVSADERRKDGNHFLITNTFGPVVHEINETMLIKRGNILPIEMRMIKTDYVDYIYRDVIEDGMTPNWVDMINLMDSDYHRNKLIKNTIYKVIEENPKHRVLVLCARVERCKILKESVRKYNTGLMIGGIKNRTECDRTIAGLISGKIRIAFGTTVADEALDIPPLTHVFVTYPVHTHLKKLKQMVGRCARPYKDKRVGIVYYFWDVNMFPMHKTGIPNFLKKFETVCDKIVCV